MTTVVVSEEACIALKTLHPALNGCSRTLALPISYFTRKLRRTLGADIDMTSKINRNAMKKPHHEADRAAAGADASIAARCIATH